MKKAAPPGRNRPAAPPPARKPRLGRRIIRFVLHWSLVAAIWVGIAVAAVLGWYAWQLPPIDHLDDATRRPAITVLAADGSILASYGDQYGNTLAVGDLPPWLPQAVMAIEDRRFRSHFGVDLIGLARAAWANHRAGRVVQGGSTLTQQVAKNVFLTPERSFKRKVQEVLLALWLEHRYDKDQILAIYLNRVYLGAGTYGMDGAARRYFDKPASRVSLYEAAVLAGLLKAPARYSPARDPALSADRARTVLAAMVDAGYITEAQALGARAEAAGLARAAERRPGRHFADWIADQVPGFVSYADRDLVVQTTLDPVLQRTAETQVRAMLRGEAATRRVGEAAAVVLARDGAVRAMVGGEDYAQSQFNRATAAFRQPGSAFKPFVYLAALEAGMTPQSTVLDARITLGRWSPENFDRRYRGEVTLTDALAESLNTATVRLAQQVGLKRISATARRMGLTGPLAGDLAVALGTSEVTLLELTGAFAAIPNRGEGVWPYGITAIRDRAGHTLWQRRSSGAHPVLAPTAAAAMDGMLAEVVRRGTGKNAALAVRTAGKTGTSQDFRDAWFVGYAGGLTAGVWMGNDDRSPMDKVTGGELPAKLWRGLMQAAVGPAQALAN